MTLICDSQNRQAPPETLSPLSTEALIITALEDAKGVDIVQLPLSDTSIADTMIIASGSSRRHLLTMADHVRKSLTAHGKPLLSIEGEGTSDWVVLDNGDVVVHLFLHALRDFYALEKLWG